MRRPMRTLGTFLALAGALTLVWALLVWQWQDPFTALYTQWKQRQLTSQYDKLNRSFPRAISNESPSAERRSIALAAKRYRLSATRGQAIGRLRIPRMGVNMIFVNGTDHDTLKKGPGRDGRTFMPGENRLVYIAGHRTTYLAPLRRVDDLRRGDQVVLTMPYGRFTYLVERTQIVEPTALWVTRDVGYQRLVLSACHPLYSAAQRIIAFARLEGVEARGAAVGR